MKYIFSSGARNLLEMETPILITICKDNQEQVCKSLKYRSSRDQNIVNARYSNFCSILKTEIKSGLKKPE